MRSTILACSTLSLLLLTPAIEGHGGGPYRGPGDLVPPQSVWQGWWRTARHQYQSVPSRRIADLRFDRMVLPRLQAMLVASEDAEVTRATIECLARLGRGRQHAGVHRVLLQQLGRGDAAARHSALLGLGVAGDARSLQLLVHVARNTLWGREQLDPQRHRSISLSLRREACRGLGRLASAPGVRGRYGCQVRIQAALAEVLQDPALADLNLRLAAIEALGRVSPATVDADRHDRALGRRTLRVLTRYYDGRLPRRLEPTRWRVPEAVAEFLGPGNSGYHRYFKERFRQDLESPRKSWPDGARRRAAALALGRLILPSGDDPRFSRMLQAIAVAQSEPELGWWCRLALGRIGGEANRRFLLRDFERGAASNTVPWSAIALGVACARQRVRSQSVSEIAQALALRRGESKSTVVREACGLALGLCAGSADRGTRLAPRDVDVLLATGSDRNSASSVRVGALARLARCAPPH